MAATKRMKRALVSVFHKDGLDEILKKLHSEGVSFVSTGGTQSFIESLGLPCDAVEDLTSYPSILGGRVKTLHPKVFGGILARRENENDQKQLAEYEIPEIDLVIVDLYPFEETVASGAEEQAIIEKIDIGGISLIRAAAKNFKDVVIVASKAQYQPLMDLLNEKGAETSIEDRRWFAKEAFAVSSGYDSAIFNYFDGRKGSTNRIGAARTGCKAGNTGLCRHLHTRIEGVDAIDGLYLWSDRIVQLIVVLSLIADSIAIKADVAVCVYKARIHVEAGRINHLRIFSRDVLTDFYNLPMINQKISDKDILCYRCVKSSVLNANHLKILLLFCMYAGIFYPEAS